MAASTTMGVDKLAAAIRTQLSRLVIGQDEVIDELIAVFVTGGNVLLEGNPGSGKTLLAKCLARCLALEFKRAQFTPDMMPADLLGTRIFDFQSNRFVFVKGPLFTDVLLADEINRTPPKTQAALLEAMEEKQITIAGETHVLSDHFFVMATQNPLEMEGTYPLPEAMLDRFWCKVVVGYPGRETEAAILDRYERGMVDQEAIAGLIEPVTDAAGIGAGRREVREVHVEASIKDYILGLIHQTRQDPDITWGLSTRAALIWMHLAKAWAAMQGRDFVIPDDVKRMAAPVMRHRLILAPEALLQGRDIEVQVQRVLDAVPVPA